jgi:hypothetical protein
MRENVSTGHFGNVLLSAGGISSLAWAIVNSTCDFQLAPPELGLLTCREPIINFKPKAFDDPALARFYVNAP